MSIEINLMAWRAQARQRRRRCFHLALLLAVGIGLGSGTCLLLVGQQQLYAQQQRNAHIEARLAELAHDVQLASIHAATVARMREQVETLDALHKLRGEAVTIFSQLVANLEQKVQYSRLVRQGETLYLMGVADDARRVFDQLHALAAVPTLGAVVLSAMEADELTSRQHFSLRIQRSHPEDIAGEREVAP